MALPLELEYRERRLWLASRPLLRLDQSKQSDTLLTMKYELSIVVGTIEADNLEKAMKKANQRLSFYAESNDGSEVLANADPILKEMPE